MMNFGEDEFAPQTNYRIPPLCIAALKRRIHRPSYVPVGTDGERIPRTEYLSGAVAAEHRSRLRIRFTGNEVEGGATGCTLPNVHSCPNSPTAISRPKAAICIDSPPHSCMLPGADRPKTAAAQIHSDTALVPACLTSDYTSLAKPLQWLEAERSGNSTPDLDVMKVYVDLSPLHDATLADGSVVSYGITTTYPHQLKAQEKNSPNDKGEEPMTPRPLSSPRRVISASKLYTSTCKMLNVPVSQSLYRCLHLSTINLKYHILSESQFRAFAVALAKTTSVNSLDISSTGLTDRSFCYLCDVLHTNYTIKRLSAADNKLSSVSAHRLLDIMDDNGSVEYLDMSGNAFKDSDGAYFAEMIKVNPALKNLHLNHCLFGTEAGRHLGQAVCSNRDLLTLDLSWNQFRKEGAWHLISQVSLGQYLKVLDLSWNGLALDGCTYLAELFKTNSALTSLNIASNRITQEGLRVLTNGLIKNTSLEVLKVGQNPITHRGVFEFLIKLKCLELSNLSVLSSLKVIDFSDVLVSREVIKLRDHLQEGYPHLQFIFGCVSHDSGTQGVAKQHHVTLTTTQAKIVLYEILKGTGASPEHILPKNANIRWTVSDLKSALQVMSLPLTNSAIDLILRRVASNGEIIPSDILNRDPKKKHCQHVQHAIKQALTQ